VVLHSKQADWPFSVTKAATLEDNLSSSIPWISPLTVRADVLVPRRVVRTGSII